MNWEAFGAIGEWAGGIAVLATLWYLARQIHQQNAVAKYEASKTFYDALNAQISLVVNDVSVGTTYLKALENPSGLTQNEALRFQNLFRIFFNNMLSAFKGYKLGFLDEEEWADLAGLFASQLHTPGGKVWREGQDAIFVEFFQAIDSIHESHSKNIDHLMGKEFSE